MENILELNGEEILHRAELLLLDVNNALFKHVPEFVEEDETIDDEAVLALLKEGGHPPNQLALPSIYQANQRVLEKLSTANTLRIELTQLLILSKRYGLRKEGSFLVIHPPSGCPRKGNEPQTIRIPLYELEDKLSKLLRKNARNNSGANYFEGRVDLARSVDLKLDILNETMQEWINNSPNGSIRIELFGHINPPGTIVRGELCSPDRFAYAIVPLGPLLGTVTLDLAIQCNLIADLATKATVASRMLNINFGTRTTGNTQALSDKMGTIAVRVSVVSVKDPTQEPLPFSEQVTAGYDAKNGPVYEALDFVPEFPPARTVGVEHETAPATGLQQSADDAPLVDADDSSVYALVLCALEDFTVPVESLLEAEHKGARPVLSVAYKSTSSERDVVEAASAQLHPGEQDILIDQFRIHHLDASARWTPPVLEVWLSWNVDEDGELRAQRRLLGLAKFPKRYKVGSTVLLAVQDVARGVRRGGLRAACVVGSQAEATEITAQCVLQAHYLDRQSRPLRPLEPGDNPPPATGAVADGLSAAPSGECADGRSDVRAKSSASRIRPLGGEPVSVKAGGTGGGVRVEEGATETKTPDSAPGRRQHLTGPPPVPADTVATTNSSEPELSEDEILFLLNQSNADDEPEQDREDVHMAEPSMPSSGRAATSNDGNVPSDDTSDSMERQQLPERDTGRLMQAIGASETNVGSSSSARARSHILELSVSGVCGLLKPHDGEAGRYELFGCLLCYALCGTDTKGHEGVEDAGLREFSLWWDAEFPVMNATQGHRFTTSAPGPGNLANALLGDADAESLVLRLCAADMDGNLVKPVRVLGSAELPLSQLSKFIDDERGNMEFTLPVQLTPAARQLYLVGAEGSRLELTLRAFHRVEPVLLRQSQQITKLHEQETSEAESSGAEETKAPATDASPMPVQSATAERPVAALLGFEITQVDLERMVAFRDPDLPLPWVPFLDRAEVAVTMEATMEYAPLPQPVSSARVVTKVADSDEVEGDFIPLRRKLLALDSIKDMFSTTDEWVNASTANVDAHNLGMAVEEPVHEGQPDQEPSHSVQGQGDGRSVADEDQDAGADIYPSDFESWDEGTMGTMLQRARELAEGKPVVVPGHDDGHPAISGAKKMSREEEGSEHGDESRGTVDHHKEGIDDDVSSEGSASHSSQGRPGEEHAAAPIFNDGAASVRSSLWSIATGSSGSSDSSGGSAPDTSSQLLDRQQEESLGLVAALSHDEREHGAAADAEEDGWSSEEDQEDVAVDDGDLPRYESSDDEYSIASVPADTESPEEELDYRRTHAASKVFVEDSGVHTERSADEGEERDSSLYGWDREASRVSQHEASGSVRGDRGTALEQDRVDEESRSLNASQVAGVDQDANETADEVADASLSAAKDSAVAQAADVEVEGDIASGTFALDQGPVAMATSGHLHADENECEDSPNTSKIKGIVDTRLGEVFGPEIVAHPLPQRADPAIVLKPTAVTEWKRLERPLPQRHGPEPTRAPMAQATQTLNSVSDVSKPQLSLAEQERLRIRQLVESQARRLEQSRTQGQKGKDIKAENERVSRLMMQTVFRRAGAI